MKYLLNFCKCIINTFSIDYHLWKASPRSTLSLAGASPKAANIHNRWLSCRRQRSLRSSHEQYKIVLEEGEHKGRFYSLLVFALFEDVI